MKEFSSVLNADEIEFEEGEEGFYNPLTALFERPSRKRNRRNGEQAQQRRRKTAKTAVRNVIDIRHHKRGRVENKQQFELLRNRASRLVAHSRLTYLREELIAGTK